SGRGLAWGSEPCVSTDAGATRATTANAPSGASAKRANRNIDTSEAWVEARARAGERALWDSPWGCLHGQRLKTFAPVRVAPIDRSTNCRAAVNTRHACCIKHPARRHDRAEDRAPDLARLPFPRTANTSPG